MAVSAVRRSCTRRWEQRMSDGLYVTSCEPGTGRAAVSLGLFDLLARRVDRLGVFRPGVSAVDGFHPSLHPLPPPFSPPEPDAAGLGAPPAHVLARSDEGLCGLAWRVP